MFDGLNAFFNDPSMSFQVVWDYGPQLLRAAGLTLELTAGAVLFGTIIGLILAMARLSNNRLIKALALIYIEFFRGSPLMIQILLLYFGVFPLLGLGEFDIMAGLVALALNSGAYVAEIFRGAIESIDRGQVEAARSLGMSGTQAMRYVVLPQAFKRALPPLGNEFIAMLKDSALVSVISVEELTRKGMQAQNATGSAIPIYFTLAIAYLAMTLVVSMLVRWMERKMKTT